MHCHCTTCTHDVHKPHTFIPLRQCFQGLGPLQRGHTHPALLNFLQISFYCPLYLSNLVKVHLTIIFSYAKWKSNCPTSFSFSKICNIARIFLKLCLQKLSKLCRKGKQEEPKGHPCTGVAKLEYSSRWIPFLSWRFGSLQTYRAPEQWEECMSGSGLASTTTITSLNLLFNNFYDLLPTLLPKTQPRSA